MFYKSIKYSCKYSPFGAYAGRSRDIALTSTNRSRFWGLMTAFESLQEIEGLFRQIQAKITPISTYSISRTD